MILGGKFKGSVNQIIKMKSPYPSLAVPFLHSPCVTGGVNCTVLAVSGESSYTTLLLGPSHVQIVIKMMMN